MENFCEYLGINKTVSLICCIFWIFSAAVMSSAKSLQLCVIQRESQQVFVSISQSEGDTTISVSAMSSCTEDYMAEGNSISMVVGSKVILRCKNRTNDTLTQLTWKMNKILLFSFIPNKRLHENKEALPPKTNMSLSEGELYSLVIERAEKSHTGNYTCEINTDKGSEEQNWELIITEHEESENFNKLLIAVAVTVPCVCCLIFIIAFAILRRVCKPAGGRSRSAEMQEREEDIYENCLETNQRRGYNRPNHYKPRAH